MVVVMILASEAVGSFSAAETTLRVFAIKSFRIMDSLHVPLIVGHSLEFSRRFATGIGACVSIIAPIA